MKWRNPGHEYDVVYKKISEKKKFYLFGAGDYGRQFLDIMEKEIKIAGFIDNSYSKQQKGAYGYSCYSLSEIKNENNNSNAIIVTVSPQRGEIIAQLESAGYKKNEDYFMMGEFLSVYFVYKYDQVYFSSISFLPSTVCNLKCELCLNFNPFAKKYYVREWHDIQDDIDLFFKHIDHIMLFHVSGGEPLLYAHTAELIRYLDENYGSKINKLRTITNGTIVPSQGVLAVLSQCNVEVVVDDYRDTVPLARENFEKVLEALKAYNIKYYVNKVDEWFDMAPGKTDFSHCTDIELQCHFDECCPLWQELRDGKLYSCNYDAYATVAGINPEADEEAFDLRSFDSSRKKELIEFRLGYNAKGYTNFCKKCRGFSEQNQLRGIPAKQMD